MHDKSKETLNEMNEIPEELLRDVSGGDGPNAGGSGSGGGGDDGRDGQN